MKYLDLYKLLNKSNCRACGLPTCMAFAHAVINSGKKIGDCPHLNKHVVEGLNAKIVRRDQGREYELAIRNLKKAVSGMNFSIMADALGARIVGGRLCIKCLGRDFYIDTNGNVESDCHIITWVTLPLLSYIKSGGGPGLSGRWVSFEELKNGPSMLNFFNRRCIEPLRQIAESHTDIFFDLLDIFGGQEIEGFTSDYSRIIYPLPRVPFLVLYSRPEGEFQSRINILFDSTADAFLEIDPLCILSRGIVEMFKKLIDKHEELLPGLRAM
ncbi:MAG: DUF3786 domain-containing protein [Nitrospiraceae bacterium]|nr:MAG: DUF3786 domain-containing protein [Nitrospiraceae bacterium]